MITISNDDIAVRINEKGAELQSLQSNGIEYMWQAQPEWAKHSPVLFPIVGELKDGAYIFKDKTYQLSRHGFARDKTFEALKTSESSAEFILTSNDKTLAVYPFHFIFKLRYRLDAGKLYCTYLVENTNNETMYFHPRRF
jgi:galactose mutarotase-like enzyme